MIARLDPWKDFDTLLQAAAIIKKQHRQIKFLLVGDGELRTYLEERISQMALRETVLILGEKKNINNYINLADISILSTRGEGFANSILESMAFAKPVIVTDVGGNAELVGRKGDEGFLAPPQSPIVFAELIGKLADDENLRKIVGCQARKKIEKMCDIKTFVGSYTLLFEQSISGK
jgi:glycosyltransferase involved in cell wall biosynthesis